MKASAGSGKTYNLARKYILILLQSRKEDAYRHILAVTFTNKATAEMKSRILSELKTLADTPEKSPYLTDFVNITHMSQQEIQRLSKFYLLNILHDYSAFAVSTIDKFFQQTLKAFSREIGYMSSYQVELDQNLLLQETVDRILDSLTEDNSELIQWMNDNMLEQLTQGKRFSIDSKLVQTAFRIKSSRFDDALKNSGLDSDKLFEKERLEGIRRESSRIVSDFVSEVKSAAAELDGTLTDKESGYLQEYLTGFYGDKMMERPKATLAKAVAGSRFLDLFENDYVRYCTAYIISEKTYALGFAREFEKVLSELLKEKNVLSLDDSNVLLKRIIDGTDAPFIYEKLGVRYENFLLDEFQDTSHIQWGNFLPLIRESDDNGRDNLIVGDVKQSIYRWRGSDWNLLESEVPARFPDSRVDSLGGNYRSLSNIVGFNSSFFEYAAEKLDSQFGPVDGKKISDLYSDVRQTVEVKSGSKGMVKVSFCDRKSDDGTNPMLAAALGSVRSALDAGASFGDIAVLVRTGKDGAKVANSLVEEGFPVVSDDTLDVKLSSIVRLLVARLALEDNPLDTTAAFVCAGLDVDLNCRYHSLVDMCEEILRGIEKARPLDYESETAYIQSFMDCLQDWVSVNGNDLHSFLSYWNNQKSIDASTPPDDNSIKIMTVHKSKGLEFRYVVFPYADDVTFWERGNWDWCELDGMLYPVDYSQNGTPDTSFSGDYEKERGRLAVDALNIFYVALTRAKCCLHIIAQKPSGVCVKALKSGKAYSFGNMGEILYHYLGGMDVWQSGEMFDFRSFPEIRHSGLILDSAYHSIAMGGRLEPSTEAADYFGEDGYTGTEASARLSGLKLHALLATVSRPEDLTRHMEDEGCKMLYERVSAHPEWFNGSGLNEIDIIGPDGSLNRPDRVTWDGDKVVVIDYKFGARKDSYIRQVRRYVELYRSMGYKDVSGYVWYVREDNVVPCQ